VAKSVSELRFSSIPPIIISFFFHFVLTVHSFVSQVVILLVIISFVVCIIIFV
jgi:hypothetical protein